MTTTDEFAVNDAAYVLGALSTNERLAFEHHILACDPCTTRIARLRAATDLLAYAPDSSFDEAPDSSFGEDTVQHIEQHVMDTAVPETVLPDLLRAVRGSRRRRRLVTAMIGAVAASVVAVAVLLFGRAGGNDDSFRPPAQALQMAAVSGAQISVRMQIETKDTWAQVNLWCSYPVNGFDAGDYKAVARTRSGRTVVIGSWPSVPGNTAIVRTPTGLHTDEIATIEVLSPSGQALSWATF